MSKITFFNQCSISPSGAFMPLHLGIDSIDKTLRKKEEQLDSVMTGSRQIVRDCSNAIKALHAYDLKTARAHLKDAEKNLKEIRALSGSFPGQLNHILQEYAEARIVLSAIEKKKIPSFGELDVGEIPYLNGLLDAIGELKREMYESLRRGNRHEAKYYFAMMEQVYDELLPLRFSNAVLPDFRHKQDVARMQIEQARGELLEVSYIVEKKS
jgi:translin